MRNLKNIQGNLIKAKKTLNVQKSVAKVRKFEDTKGVIRSRRSMINNAKDEQPTKGQHNTTRKTKKRFLVLVLAPVVFLITGRNII
jgi:hypothetical protein